MAAAFLEWFLWLAAFIYCLFKVYQKAEHWSVQILALIVGILFTLLRYASMRQRKMTQMNNQIFTD